MNIKKSALYLVGGLYFLFFSAACVCNHPGSGMTQTPESPKQEQQQAVAAPANYSAEAAGEDTVVEEGSSSTIVSGQEGTVVEEGSSSAVVSGDEGTVVDEGTTEVVSSDEGTVVEEGSSTPVEETPADGTPVSE